MSAAHSILRLAVLSASCAIATAQCPDWDRRFGDVGVSGGPRAFSVFQGELVLAGNMFGAGGAAIGHAARWNGVGWRALGAGLDGEVLDLELHDDGSGPSLFAGGRFSNAGGAPALRVARWNGASWFPLGGGMNGLVSALATFDEGAGVRLFAGGVFTTAGGVAADFIARWDGSAWSALGAGVNGSVDALVVWNDGTGPALYAGGSFTLAGGATAANVAKWNGSSWSALGAGTDGRVWSLAVFDDGSGAKLFAGGAFANAGGASASRVARWDGTSWSALASGVSGPSAVVKALVAHDDGSGPKLFAGGSFASAGGGAAANVARWSGASWSALPSPPDGTIEAFQAFDDGSGPALFVAGDFANAGGILVNGVARWSGSSWSKLGNGIVDGAVTLLETFDDGSGPKLCAIGAFEHVGVQPLNGIARFDGTSWTNLGSGANNTIRAVQTFRSAGVDSLYVGGHFSSIDGTLADYVARWSGGAWTSIGGVAGSPGGAGTAVLRFALHDDGGGEALYVGGSFTSAGGVPALRIARFDGASWSALGSGITRFPTAMASFDDGAARALYVATPFHYVGGAYHGSLLRWDGTSWTEFADFSGPLGSVDAMCVFDDGLGPRPALYIAGAFASVDSVAASNIVRWDGTTWSALSSGVNGSVTSLEVFDEGDGNGAALVVGGRFTSAGGIGSPRVARWSGSAWRSFGGGASYDVLALRRFGAAGSSVDSLALGGSFASVGDTPSVNFALRQACDAPGAIVCIGDGSGSACPCGNASASADREGCLSSLGTGGRLRANGRASVTSDTLTVVGSRMPDSSVLYFEGTSRVNGGAGSVFGDGLRCAGGLVARLGLKTNVAGTSRYPDAGDAPISAAGSAAPSSSRVYQAWYRNSAPFCTSATFNLTNAVEIHWTR